MNHQPPLRVGAVAAVAGALAQAAATVLEPDWSGEPADAIRTVSGSGIWTLDRLLDLVGLFLAVGALAVVGHTFAGLPGRDWARVGQPFLVLVGALGASAVLAGATLKDVADAWTTAGPAAKPAYLATFDAASSTTDAFFFGAFMTLGLYLGTLAAAILAGGPYPRWTGWASAGGALLVLGGDLLMLVAEAAFLAVLAGFALFTAVLVALGVTMWRQAARPTTADQPPTRTPGPPASARRPPR
jgi:hypothetical protein